MRNLLVLTSALLVFFLNPFNRVNGQENYYNYFGSDVFDAQERCIHHDNFYRQVIGKDVWKIGDNYGPKDTYYSPRNDYSTVDDGFRIKAIIEQTNDKDCPERIVSGYLTNDPNVIISKSFRLIKAYEHLTGDFFIETSLPSEGKYAEVVFNFIDESNYESFEITNSNQRIQIIKKHYAKGKESVLPIYNSTVSYTGNAIRFIRKDNSVIINIDGCEINQFLSDKIRKELLSLIIDARKPVGVLVAKEHSYEYRVLDLGLYDSFRCISANRSFNNNGIPTGFVASFVEPYSYQFKPTLRVCGVGNKLPSNVKDYQVNSKFLNIAEGKIYRWTAREWVETGDLIDDYGMYYDTYSKRLYTYDSNGLVLQHIGEQMAFPEFVQRFEIRASDVKDTKTAHCELAEKTNKAFDNLVLKKRIVKFNTLLPVGFLKDDNSIGGESIIQFQIGTDGGKSRGPLFTIATSVVGDKKRTARFHLNRRYIPTRPISPTATFNEEVFGEDDVDLGEVVLGVWDRWEICIKEGYMKEHNPLLIVKKNDVIVYQSVMPNTYNVKYGSYIRYGLYKSIYKKDNTLNRKRVIYISDFKCDI